jgi:hypothetical protein
MEPRNEYVDQREACGIGNGAEPCASRKMPHQRETKRPADRHNPSTSVITAKAANDYHFKTGQRKSAGT